MKTDCRIDVARAFFLVSLVICAPQVADAAATSKRYRELTRVIDKNTGRAHLTRGVNMCTILALSDEASSPDDTRILGEMLSDEDYVVFLAAHEVLVTRGAEGIAALETFMLTRRAHDGRRSDVASAIQGAEQTARSLEGYRREGSCRIRK